MQITGIRTLSVVVSVFAIIACQVRRETSTSEVLSNGQLTTEHAFVRRIERAIGDKRKVATGVFLAPGFMMAPAHFLDRSKSDCGVTVEGVRAAVCRIHPGYNPNDLTEDGAQSDFAFLYFPSQYNSKFTGKPDHVRLGGFNIGQTQMDATLYGFGSPWVDRVGGVGDSRRETGGDMTGIGGDMTGIGGDMTGIEANAQATDGKKRKCLIKMERKLLREEMGRSVGSGKVGFQYMTIKFPIDNSGACVPAPGDSGGPIFNEQNQLIGIASRVAYSGPKLSEATFVTIANNSLLEFMKTSRMEHASLQRSGRL